VEGPVIGLVFIAFGFGFAWLAYSQFKDWRRGKGEFVRYEEDTSGRWRILNAKLRHFNSHLNLWIFAVLAPFLVVVGVVAMVRGE
jgi:ABC-type antimicrobial peptide transport system permease subunit